MDTGGGNANENTGRWTHEEHERFLQGLEMYGKKWTKVAEVVRTRTTVQVRSHAQKYFQKQTKGRIDGEPVPGTGAGVRRSGIDLEALRKTNGVPPPLKPFVPEGTRDIAVGLYSYLSPSNIPSGSTSQVQDPVEANRNTVPRWYRHGLHMENLLEQAEQLDWNEDSGNNPPRPDAAMAESHRGSLDSRDDSVDFNIGAFDLRTDPAHASSEQHALHHDFRRSHFELMDGLHHPDTHEVGLDDDFEELLNGDEFITPDEHDPTFQGPFVH